VLPRVEPGRITAVDHPFYDIELDTGERLNAAIPFGYGYRAGWRVLVTFGSMGQIVRVGRDLSLIGMTELEATNLANVEARLEVMLAEAPLTAEQREMFATVVALHRDAASKTARRLADRMARSLGGDTLPITIDDAWASTARTDLATIAQRESWVGLLSLEGSSSKPTKKWNAAASAEVQRIGIAAFVDTVRRWFALVGPRPMAAPMGDANSDGLRNLVWACATVDDPKASEQLAVAVGDLAVRCFTKIPNVGAVATKVGNACIYVLSQLPGMRAVSQLSRLGSRLRYKQALALVEKAKLACAKRAGVSPIDLEELALPTFGLDVDCRTHVEVSGYVAEIAVSPDDKVSLTFFDGDKALKSVPAALKSTEELAEVKALHKELASLVPTVRARLERWMFEPRSWSLADLRARYLDHPLVGRLARRVIFATGDTSVVFFDGRPLDRTGREVELVDTAVLSLWHPLGRSDDEVSGWRSFLATLDITQPFKQIDREIYLVAGEADAYESARFSGHTLRQHQLAALLRERGWTYSLMGAFDSDNTPTKRIPMYDVTVTFDVDVPYFDSPTADSGIYLEVTTGRVRFMRDDSALQLAEVPARCFSEVMRDIDLFVSGARVER
jgi:hypothetical protein